jgi:hypothetical protein
MERGCSFGAGLRVSRGPFAFSGKHLEALAIKLALWAAEQLRPHNVKGPIGLAGVYNVPTDGVSDQIGNLKSRRVVFLVHHTDIQFRHLANCVSAISNTSELKFKKLVFRPAATFKQHMGCCRLLFINQMSMQTLHAKRQCNVIGIAGIKLFFHVPGFINDGSNHSEWRLRQSAIHVLHECGIGICVDQYVEIAMLFANFMAMKNNTVMAEEFEFDALPKRNHISDIVIFIEDTEHQHKHRILRVDRQKIMVTAFIGIDNIVTKTRHAASRIAEAGRNYCTTIAGEQ